MNKISFKPNAPWVIEEHWAHFPFKRKFMLDSLKISYRIHMFTPPTNLSTSYLVMCKVYTNVGGIKYIYHVCSPVRKIIHSLKLVDDLHVQADNQCYNYYLRYHQKGKVSKRLSLYPFFLCFFYICTKYTNEPRHVISNNVVF